MIALTFSIELCLAAALCDNRRMTHILRVDGADAKPLEVVSMQSQGLTEVAHLEQWIVKNPTVLGKDLMVVTTQFNSWESSSGKASERPDILALSTDGRLVVIELKRERDRRIHLQALTYAALASSFNLDSLSAVHAEWLASQGAPASIEVAQTRLTGHVDEWSDDRLGIPRMILVAESFPSQVVTTAQWLTTVSPLEIECHEYQIFGSDDDLNGTYVAFNQLFPIEDLEKHILRPSLAQFAQEEQSRSEVKRRARSVTIIAEHHAIPEDSSVTLAVAGQVQPKMVTLVEQWLSEHVDRRDVRWRNHPTEPLTWKMDNFESSWTPSALRNEIFRRANAGRPVFSAADAWFHGNKSLYSIAKSLTADEE